MITIYTGPMFSGKSSYLLGIYDEVEDKSTVLCFKPSKDTREKTTIKSRDGNKAEAIVISNFEDIEKYIKENTKTIIIDEAQFIDGNYNILTKLSIENDINIFIGGLAQTSEQKPFNSMPYLLALADNIEVLEAKCECGKVARYTYCKVKKEDTILVGDKEYKPLCRECLLKYKNNVN